MNKILPLLENEYIIMAPTHKACSVLIQNGLDANTVALMIQCVEQESKAKWMTRMANKFTNKTVIIDECYMLSLKDIKALYEIKRDTNVRFILIGDSNQLTNPEQCGFSK